MFQFLIFCLNFIQFEDLSFSCILMLLHFLIPCFHGCRLTDLVWLASFQCAGAFVVHILCGLGILFLVRLGIFHIQHGLLGYLIRSYLTHDLNPKAKLLGSGVLLNISLMIRGHFAILDLFSICPDCSFLLIYFQVFCSIRLHLPK